MSSIFTICRWEWFKLQRRRMPWILLAILFAFSQISIWGSYASYAITAARGGQVLVPTTPTNPGRPRMVSCNALEKDAGSVLPADTSPQIVTSLAMQCQVQRASLATRYRVFAPAGSVTLTLSVAAGLGIILLGILSASVVGIEYGLGTLRPILTRGTGRLPWLAGKYLMLAGVTTAALLLVCAAAAGSGALAGKIAPPPPDGPNLLAISWSSLGISFVKTWGALLAFVTMAGAVTLLVRSTAVGMAISLGYYIGEGILIRLLSIAFDWIDTVGNYLPMRNISTLASFRTNIAAAVNINAIGISPLHASVVVAAYAIALAAVAAVVFRRRDVVGAVGS
jgi:ABC-type transport system involved in multi-copper enzyme maturation permease subunit